MKVSNRIKLLVKKWLGISIIICALGFWAWISITDTQEQIQKVEIVFVDSFQIYTKESVLKIIQKEVNKILNNSNIKPDFEIMEDDLRADAWVEKVNIYVVQHKLIVKIKFKKPSMKIVAKNKQIYYLDYEGQLMPSLIESQVNLPLAINVEVDKFDSLKPIQLKKIAALGKHLIYDSVWKNKTYYFDFKNTNAIQMITYNPSGVFLLGDLQNIKNKLYKILFFQHYASLHHLAFATVDVQYKNQILGINKNYEKQ